jgi:DNA-binding response OmpR family regulator
MTSNILVLNDLVLAELLRNQLEKTYDRVSITDSVQSALKFLKKRHFDLLILPEVLPDDESGYRFLQKWRSDMKNTGALVLMVTGRKGYQGIVRGPVHKNQANAYISFPFPVGDFLEIVSNLLAGASTQCVPGDEGYISCESQDLHVAFKHPAFWKVGSRRSARKAEDFERLDVVVTGPLNRYQTVYSSLIVVKYSPIGAIDRLVADVVVEYEFREKEDLRQIKQGRRVWVDAGLQGKEMAYVWSAEGTPTYQDSMWQREEELVKSLVAVVRRHKAIYILRLTAADEEFEDFRQVYVQMIKTFEFLE